MGATTLNWPSQKCCFVVRWWDLFEEGVNIWTRERVVPDKDFCIKDIQVGTCKACSRISRVKQPGRRRKSMQKNYSERALEMNVQKLKLK